MQRNTLISQPFDMIVFGGRGDLARRKLIPALYHLDRERRLPDDGRIIAVSRGAMANDAFVQMMHDDCQTYSTNGSDVQFDEISWGRFARRLTYLGLDATDAKSYDGLAQLLKGREEVIRAFYLATTKSPGAGSPGASPISASMPRTPRAMTASRNC
jgi:glucose-6-phosphate 1-dehydrogenase